ncbi:MAG: potassium-transporting ATPase subunit KdpA [Planctomycetes bacterium]|nr:potassium-transporting ATPase subunit KdpA [Planctomycetota bacterium]
MTNTNLQHYSGDQHLSNFSQVGFILFNMFTSAAVGFCALIAMIRGLRGDTNMGNYYQDVVRVLCYVYLPASLLKGIILLAEGVPMTLAGQVAAETLESGTMGTDAAGHPEPQRIARAAVCRKSGLDLIKNICRAFCDSGMIIRAVCTPEDSLVTARQSGYPLFTRRLRLHCTAGMSLAFQSPSCRNLNFVRSDFPAAADSVPCTGRRLALPGRIEQFTQAICPP